MIVTRMLAAAFDVHGRGKTFNGPQLPSTVWLYTKYFLVCLKRIVYRFVTSRGEILFVLIVPITSWLSIQLL